MNPEQLALQARKRRALQTIDAQRQQFAEFAGQLRQPGPGGPLPLAKAVVGNFVWHEVTHRLLVSVSIAVGTMLWRRYAPRLAAPIAAARWGLQLWEASRTLGASREV